MEKRKVLKLAIAAALFCVYGNAPAWNWPSQATKEAQTAAEAAIYDRVTKCEESYFLKIDENNYLEITGISVSATPEEVTEVDKANGVEWKGGMLVTAKMYRKLQKFSNGNVTNGKWNDGSAGIPGISGLISFYDSSGKDRKLGFRKVNGQWTFDQKDTFGFFSGLPQKLAFTCMEIGRASDRMVTSVDDSLMAKFCGIWEYDEYGAKSYLKITKEESDFTISRKNHPTRFNHKAEVGSAHESADAVRARP